jgi:hypothetical protein
MDYLYYIIVMSNTKMRWAENVARRGRRGMHIGYWWESQEERDYWDNIKMDLREIGWDGVDWIDMA